MWLNLFGPYEAYFIFGPTVQTINRKQKKNKIELIVSANEFNIFTIYII